MPPAAPRRAFQRFIVVVCDSVGCGDAPDAAAFEDAGTNTLGHIIERAAPHLPNLTELGLTCVPGVPGECVNSPGAAFGRLTERSGAKDTMSGHWELMGVVSTAPFPLYPEGFPPAVMERFEAAIGVGTLGNTPASGTEIIRDLGPEHLRTGKPIVYTSGDSVFQIAAHEDVVEIERLYEMCEIARRQLDGEHRVARVIARPFIGDPPDGFERTARRKDYALPPPGPTTMDRLVEAGLHTLAVGKIHDIFGGQGISDYVKTVDNDDGVDRTIAAMQESTGELIFTNLVDFDSMYGHRRDVDGYAAALERFDARVPELLAAMRDGDCLMITADHGNDPTYRGTDHTRERVPLLVSGGEVVDLGTRASFADLGQTVLDNFGLVGSEGESFLAALTG